MNTTTTETTDTPPPAPVAVDDFFAETKEQRALAPRAHAQPFNIAELVFDAGRMRQVWQLAKIMASAEVSVPKHLHERPADCMAVIMQAMRWGMDPFVVATKTYFVGSAIGYEAQLVNAVLQDSGEVASRPHYEWRGDGEALEARAGFIPTGETEIVWSEWVKKSDQKVQNSPLWKSNPRQQMGYLQVRNWARLYAPGALLGLNTPEELAATPELRDMGDAEEVSGPQRKSAQAAIGQAEDAKTVSAPPPPAEPAKTPAPPAQNGGAPSKPAPSAAPGNSISVAQVAYLRGKLKSAGVTEQQIQDKHQVAGIEHLTVEQFDRIKADLLSIT